MTLNGVLAQKIIKAVDFNKEQFQSVVSLVSKLWGLWKFRKVLILIYS